MPCTYTVDVTRRLIVLRGQGVVASAELAELRARTATEPAFDRTFAVLVDFREMTGFDRKLSLIREMAERPVIARSARMAIVPPPGRPFGLARLFVAYAQLIGRPVEIFDEVEEAERWLGIAVPAGPE